MKEVKEFSIDVSIWAKTLFWELINYFFTGQSKTILKSP